MDREILNDEELEQVNGGRMEEPKDEYGVEPQMKRNYDFIGWMQRCKDTDPGNAKIDVDHGGTKSPVKKRGKAAKR